MGGLRGWKERGQVQGSPGHIIFAAWPPGDDKNSEPKDSRAMFSHRVKWEKQVTKQPAEDDLCCTHTHTHTYTLP